MTSRKLFAAVVSLTVVLTVTPVHAHQGHHSAAPSQTCGDKSLNAYCEYSNASQDLYRGTCREMNRQLMCVRNQAIVRDCAARNDCGNATKSSASNSPVDKSIDKSAIQAFMSKPETAYWL